MIGDESDEDEYDPHERLSKLGSIAFECLHSSVDAVRSLINVRLPDDLS